MKSAFAIFLLLGVISLLLCTMDVAENRVLVSHGNTQKVPLEIVLGKYICAESESPITKLYNSAQAILPNGDTYFFNDIGNVLLWFNRQKNKDKIVVWVYTQDKNKYILAKNAWFSRVEITPMGYGFGAYANRIYGRADYYFDEVERFAIRGETVLHPIIHKLLSTNKL